MHTVLGKGLTLVAVTLLTFVRNCNGYNIPDRRQLLLLTTVYIYIFIYLEIQIMRGIELRELCATAVDPY